MVEKVAKENVPAGQGSLAEAKRDGGRLDPREKVSPARGDGAEIDGGYQVAAAPVVDLFSSFEHSLQPGDTDGAVAREELQEDGFSPELAGGALPAIEICPRKLGGRHGRNQPGLQRCFFCLRCGSLFFSLCRELLCRGAEGKPGGGVSLDNQPAPTGVELAVLDGFASRPAYTDGRELFRVCDREAGPAARLGEEGRAGANLLDPVAVAPADTDAGADRVPVAVAAFEPEPEGLPGARPGIPEDSQLGSIPVPQRQVGAAIEVVIKPPQGAAILEIVEPAGRRDVDEASLPGCEVKAVSFPAAPGGVFADHPVDDFPAIEVALKPELPAG